MNVIILKAVEMYKKPNKSFLVLSIIITSLLLSLTWIIVYFTGGTKYVYLHLSYIPITFSAFLFREKGGITVAFIAGLLMGPFMPLDVENNIAQPPLAYLYRIFFFILIGAFVGYMSRWLKINLIKAQETLDEISIIYANTLENYAKMVSTRDEQTAFHCERVAFNSQLLGRAIGLDKHRIDALYWAGLLHDVGKIGIKEEILLKPGKLTSEEFKEVSRHTLIGYDLVNSLSKDFNMIAEGVRSHHEKWDGSGYPDGLKCKEIPLFGRIIMIVDVFEALTSERPYKNAWDPGDAMNFILEHKGIHFDPDLVEHFELLYREGKVWISDIPINLNNYLKPGKFNKELLSS